MTRTPLFLDLDDILAIHARALAEDGGDAGVRKQDALESAIASPQATYGGRFLDEFPFEMAAAYLVGFALNPAFVDGNKRVAAGAASVFLDINGFEPRLDQDAYADLVLAVAQGETRKAAVAEVLRGATVRARSSRGDSRQGKPRRKRRR